MAQKQIYRSMKQNHKPRNKPTQVRSVNLPKEARIYTEEKTIYTASNVRKTGQLQCN